MKFQISSSVLLSALSQVSRTIESKPALAILNCVLFSLGEGKLALTASDGEITMQTASDVVDSDGIGCFAVNAVQMINALREIAEQPITIEVNPANYALTLYYTNGQSSFVCQDGKEYPTPVVMPDNASRLTIPSDMLCTGIAHTIGSVANDELRPVMNSIHIDFTDQSTTFVSTDGHRLVREVFPELSTLNSKLSTLTSLSISKKFAKLVREVLMKDQAPVVLRFTDQQAQVITTTYTITSRLVEGRYPNYNAVIPTSFKASATIDRQSLIGALRRTLVFASTTTALVRLEFTPDNLSISTSDTDFSTSADEHIPCTCTDQSLTIGFKGTYLLDLLSLLSTDEVTFHLTDPTRPGIITPAVPPSPSPESATPDSPNPSPLTPQLTLLLMPMVI